jgi:hypothetical protein
MNTDYFHCHKRHKVIIGVSCFLVLYVLGIGPVAKLEDRGIIGKRTDKILNVLYAPLQALAIVPGAKQFFSWYIFHVWKCDTMGDNTI